MIRITRQIALAAAFVGALPVPAAAQVPAFDYARLLDETVRLLAEYSGSPSPTRRAMSGRCRRDEPWSLSRVRHT